eukprot:SAG31_NODE_109_length_24587_cov_111.480848_9_plen_169_part_00
MVLALLLLSIADALPFDFANAVAPVFGLVASLTIILKPFGQGAQSVKIFSVLEGVALAACLALHGYSIWYYYDYCNRPCDVGILSTDVCLEPTIETHSIQFANAVRVVTFSFLCPLLEKYGTFIARCNALIEKVSSFRLGASSTKRCTGHLASYLTQIIWPAKSRGGR